MSFGPSHSLGLLSLQADLNSDFVYDLDDAQLHRIVAHGRQDAAHAVGNTDEIKDTLAVLARQLRWSRVISYLQLAVLLVFLWKLFH